jgi:hypothetical protein
MLKRSATDNYSATINPNDHRSLEFRIRFDQIGWSWTATFKLYLTLFPHFAGGGRELGIRSISMAFAFCFFLGNI